MAKRGWAVVCCVSFKSSRKEQGYKERKTSSKAEFGVIGLRDVGSRPKDWNPIDLAEKD